MVPREDQCDHARDAPWLIVTRLPVQIHPTRCDDCPSNCSPFSFTNTAPTRPSFMKCRFHLSTKLCCGTCNTSSLLSPIFPSHFLRTSDRTSVTILAPDCPTAGSKTAPTHQFNCLHIKHSPKERDRCAMAHVASSPSTARGLSGYRGDRGLSESPPTQQLSKKDKKRNLIQDRFSEIINSFSRDRDQHYRAQLHAIQTDMNLIMRADPYSDSPLDDTGDDVAEQMNAVLGQSSPSVPSAQSDYAAMAGRSYSRFVEEVNNAMEERDAQLTQIYVRRLKCICTRQLEQAALSRTCTLMIRLLEQLPQPLIRA